MKLILLTQGKSAQVDDEDFEWLSQWKWYYDEGYAVRNSSGGHGRRSLIQMHRVICNPPDKKEVDHIDRCSINNQRSNLRVCTKTENAWNTGSQKNNTSGYKGVCWNKGRWQASIRVNGSRIHLGRFDDVKEAANSYDSAAIKYHGEFARINFPLPGA